MRNRETREDGTHKKKLKEKSEKKDAMERKMRERKRR